MRKLALILVILLVVAMPLQAHAAAKIVRTTPQISFSGNTADCTANVISARSDDHIEVTMKLTFASIVIASWSEEGYGSLTMSRQAAITPGRTYKLVVEVKINGVAQSPVSVSGTC